MSQPNFQAVGTGSETSCAWPTHAAGDWGYLVVQHGGGTVATPTDCAIVDGSPFTNGGETCSIFRILATSAAMPNLALSGGTDHMWGVIFTVRNAHQTDPTLQLANSRQSGSSTTAAAPGVVIPVDDVLVVAVFTWANDSAGPIASAPTNASLTSPTEQYDAGTVTGNGGGIVIISGTLANAGRIVETTCTITSSLWGGLHLVFAPIADKTISGTVTINGSPAANGQDVRVLDLTQPAASYLCVAGTTGGGTGAFTCSAPYTDHNYQAVYEDGASYGASAVDVAV